MKPEELDKLIAEDRDDVICLTDKDLGVEIPLTLKTTLKVSEARSLYLQLQRYFEVQQPKTQGRGE